MREFRNSSLGPGDPDRFVEMLNWICGTFCRRDQLFGTPYKFSQRMRILTALKSRCR
jgi:hypothetical protein